MRSPRSPATSELRIQKPHSSARCERISLCRALHRSARRIPRPAGRAARRAELALEQLGGDPATVRARRPSIVMDALEALDVTDAEIDAQVVRWREVLAPKAPRLKVVGGDGD